MYQYTNCIICHKKGFIQCEQCNKPYYFCSKEHLILHIQKSHKSLNDIKINNDIRKEIAINMSNQDYPSVIMLINNFLNSLKLQNQYNTNNNQIIIELLYTLAECHLNLSNLTESKNILNEIINLTEDLDNINNNINNNISFQKIIFRQKTNMILGAISLNLGEYNNALNAYFSCENELPRIKKKQELNVKLS